MNRLEVADIDGKNRSLLIWEDIDTPRDIVVNPPGKTSTWSIKNLV